LLELRLDFQTPIVHDAGVAVPSSTIGRIKWRSFYIPVAWISLQDAPTLNMMIPIGMIWIRDVERYSHKNPSLKRINLFLNTKIVPVTRSSYQLSRGPFVYLVSRPELLDFLTALHADI
jgi:hypothetical protein